MPTATVAKTPVFAFVRYACRHTVAQTAKGLPVLERGSVLRLYTFHISHFSEKARWALDFEGLAYEDKILTPGPHQLTTRRMARRTEVPILKDGARYIQGSSAILDYIAERLGGTKLKLPEGAAGARALELEREVDQAFGRGVQQVLYSVLLKPEHAHKVVDLWTDNGPRWARTFYAFTFPAISRVVQRMYKTQRPELVAKAQEGFASMMDKLDAELARAPYLGGERPSRLDIAVAALLAPVCQPKEHRVRWPATPPELLDFEARLKGRPTWNHALRMYRDHRRG